MFYKYNRAVENRITMKRHIIIFLFLVTTALVTYGQAADPLVTSCIMNAGADAKYLKDFRIQLGKGASQNDLRFKAKMSLWKNTKYRFTLCNTPDSKGQLILNIKDDANKVILSSFDLKSGKTFKVVDFECHKSGIYQLNYDFMNREQGSGVGVVSMIK
jgi:hypothetical protein